MSVLSQRIDAGPGPLAYFACAQHEASGPFAGREILGAGVSRWVKKDPCPMAEALRPPDDGPWLFAVRFDPERVGGPEWSDFGAALFWRPERWVEHHRGRPHRERSFTPAASAAGPASAPARYAEPTWDAAFAAASVQLTADPARPLLEKVVLARPFDRPPSPRPLAPVLDAARAHAHRFAFVLGENNAFFGATPELLVRAQAGDLYTEALAGTAPVADASLLLHDPKQRHEHDAVVHALTGALGELQPTVSDTHVREHGAVAHLCTTFSAAGIGDPLAWASRLAPTPAVCGTPRVAAQEFIRAYEGFDRGVYAGTVGFCDENSLFATVALRCARRHRGGLRLYAGGGLVASSVRDAERDELRHKTSQWRAHFDADTPTGPEPEDRAADRGAV